MHVAGVADRVRNDCKPTTANVTVESSESKAFGDYVDAQLADIFAREAVLA